MGKIINKERIKNWVGSKKTQVSQRLSKVSEDYYICRVCKHIYPEEKMSKDISICNECAKR